MQKLLEQKQRDEEEAEAAAKNTVIKVLMGEVQVGTSDLAEMYSCFAYTKSRGHFNQSKID